MEGNFYFVMESRVNSFAPCFDPRISEIVYIRILPATAAEEGEGERERKIVFRGPSGIGKTFLANELLGFVYHDSDIAEVLDLAAVRERVIVLGNKFPAQQQNATLMRQLETQADTLVFSYSL